MEFRPVMIAFPPCAGIPAQTGGDMSRKAILLSALAALASPAALQAQEGNLASIIPSLYGPRGLIVDSEARLPDGSTHSAHFNSAFQAEFTQFNVSLASQLASVPLPSPASGF